MWLLNAWTGQLEFFNDPSSVKYAILSHRWQENEMDFQKMNSLAREPYPLDRTSDKIRLCCLYAQREGYAYVWIDTCCIDKTSSAELSEVVNSMFHYYSRASVCYGFLCDVPSVRDSDCGAEPSWRPFLRSRWFRRGRTLHIAPRFFIFVSCSWHVIGIKAHLAELLEDRAGIPATVLRFQQEPREFSIAE